MRKALLLAIFVAACGIPPAQTTDAGAAEVPTWVSFVETFEVEGFSMRVLLLDARGRVVGLPKNGASSLIWSEGHRVSASSLTGDNRTLVTYFDENDRMAGFLASSANAAIFAKDSRGMKRWFTPPPGGVMSPAQWTSDDRLLAQGFQSGGFDNGFVALVSWKYADAMSLPEAARVLTLYRSLRLLSVNKNFDYVTTDTAVNDVIPNHLVIGGVGQEFKGDFSPLAVLDDGSAWGTLVTTGPHLARWFDGGLNVLETESTLLAMSPSGNALYGAGGRVWVRPDRSTAPLQVPLIMGGRYHFNDEGRVALQLIDGATWLYTPRTFPNPLGENALTLANVGVSGLDSTPVEATSVRATSTQQGFFLELGAGAGPKPWVLRLQALLNRAPVAGDQWRVGVTTVGGKVQQVLLGWTQGEATGNRVFLATTGNLTLSSLEGNVARLTLDNIAFSEVDQPAFTLSGTIEVRSVNEP